MADLRPVLYVTLLNMADEQPRLHDKIALALM